MPTIHASITLDTDDLIEALLAQDYPVLQEFIKALDLRVADYEFTLDLAKHFAKECQSCAAEGDDPFDINELLS